MKQIIIFIISILLAFVVNCIYKNISIDWQFFTAFVGGATTLLILNIIRDKFE